VTEILEGSDGVAQINRDALANVAANTALYQKQAGGGEAGGDEQHRQQETRAQAHSRQKRGGRLNE
jgi:hypothetical protein